MKKFLSGIAPLGMVCLASTGVFAQDKANGEKVHQAKCAGCPGADGKGDRESDQGAGHLLPRNNERIGCGVDGHHRVKGQNKMLGYGKKVTDADVVAYMRSLCK